MKDPTEELTGIFSSLWWWDISLALNMTYFLSPIGGVAATSPTRRTRPFCRYRDISPVSAGESTPKEEAKFVFARKRSEAGSTARPPFGTLTRATSPVSSGESTPGRVDYRVFLSPIVRRAGEVARSADRGLHCFVCGACFLYFVGYAFAQALIFNFLCATLRKLYVCFTCFRLLSFFIRVII